MTLRSLVFVACGFLPSAVPLWSAVGPFAVEQLRPEHPRLLASGADFERIRSGLNDELGQAYMAFLRETGEALLKSQGPQNFLRGKRLLQESRTAVKQISTFALLYRIDGDERYKTRALELMDRVTEFPSWNPQHYLDVGEMTLAVSIGLDWLWDETSPEKRDQYISAIIEKGINPSLDEEDEDNWWITYNNNWNPVCHAGLTAGAILIADRDPHLAERVINRALKSVPIAMSETDPDGVYPEGPGYWGYGTTFTAILIDLLNSAVGRSFGLAEHKSFRDSILFRCMAVAPTGEFYNFYDSRGLVPHWPTLAWFAKTYDEPVAHHEMRRTLKIFLNSNDWSPDNSSHGLLAFLALWYPDSIHGSEESVLDLPRAWQGDGPNPIAMIKSRWGDPRAFFLGYKGGRSYISHAHMDAGSFIYEDNGVRWAVDLGSQAYLSLESKNVGIWDRRQTSDRWRIFRIGPFSHNLLLIDEQLHDIHASAPITEFEDQNHVITGTVDLTQVNPGLAESYTRTFTVHDLKVVQIDDVIQGTRTPIGHEGPNSATLHWRMVTRAEVAIDGNMAVLSQDGETCHLQVNQPENSVFTLRNEPLDTPQNFWDEANAGITAIDIWMKTDADGDRAITVLMSTDLDKLESVATELGVQGSR